MLAEGTQNKRQQDTRVPRAPVVSPRPCGKAGRMPSGAKAAWFFLSEAALLQSWGKLGVPFAIKAEG